MRECRQCGHSAPAELAEYCPFDGTRMVDDPLIGQVLCGQIRIEAGIGRGATGTVYRAWQLGTERPVAVKVLHPHLAADAKLRSRFLREARAMARLDDEHIVRVHMVAQTDSGVPFLVMEYIEGESLAELLERDGRLPEHLAADFALQIASALAEAHAHGVIHRDLKPDNIQIVRDRRGQHRIVLLDFGVAKCSRRWPAIEEPSQLTRAGAIFGTPRYMAPEQAAGQMVDGRADLYSLGCLLYHMLAGHCPFEGNATAQLLAHITSSATPIQRLVPEVTSPMAGLIRNLMSKEPDSRIGDADQVASEIEDILIGLRTARDLEADLALLDDLDTIPEGVTPTYVA